MSQTITPEPAPPAPESFKALALRVIWASYLDIHVKAAGLTFLVILGYGVIHPAASAQCEKLAGLAGTYLFASAVARK